MSAILLLPVTRMQIVPTRQGHLTANAVRGIQVMDKNAATLMNAVRWALHVMIRRIVKTDKDRFGARAETDLLGMAWTAKVRQESFHFFLVFDFLDFREPKTVAPTNDEALEGVSRTMGVFIMFVLLWHSRWKSTVVFGWNSGWGLLDVVTSKWRTVSEFTTSLPYKQIRQSSSKYTFFDRFFFFFHL